MTCYLFSFFFFFKFNFCVLQRPPATCSVGAVVEGGVWTGALGSGDLMLSVSADEAVGSVQLLVDGATEWVQAAGAWNGSHFQLSVPAQGEGGHRVQLRVADAAGNLAPQTCSDFSWVVDTVRFCRFTVFGLVILCFHLLY